MFTPLTPLEKLRYAKLQSLTRQSHRERLLGLQAVAQARIARYEMQKVENNLAYPKLNERLQDIMVFPFMEERCRAIDASQQHTIAEREKKEQIIQVRKELFK